MRLVESEPFRGARVRAVTDEELAESYPVRAALEEVAAREAAWRLNGDVSELEAEVEGMRRAAAAGDLHTQVLHDAAFHRRIVEAAGNRVLLETWQTLGVEGRTAISLLATGLEPAEIAELHVPILEALRAREPGRAGREARRHVQRFGNLLLRTRGRR